MKLLATITAPEAAEYRRLHKIIKDTKGSFAACGKALATIRNNKLYRAHYHTFEQYCLTEWGWGRQYAYNLIKATAVLEDVEEQNVNNCLQGSADPEDVTPRNEAAARALGMIPSGDRLDTMKRVGPNATARQIAEAAKDKNAIVDKTGYEVPDKAMTCWSRRKEAKDILHAISHLRGLIKAIGPDDLMYVEVHIQGIMMRIHQLYTEFSPAVPYAVCTTCQGIAPETCTFCKGRGVISKYRYDTCVPQELKDMRK